MEETANSSVISWRYIQNSDWVSFNNNAFKLKEASDDQKGKQELDKNKKKKEKTQFYFSQRKIDVKGSVVFTPKGYGILQESLVGKEKGKKETPVKVNNKINNFSARELLYDIPIRLRIYIDNCNKEEFISIPTNSTLQDLIDKIDFSINGSEGFSATRVFLRGKEIKNSSDSLEKAGIIPNTSLVVTSSSNRKPLSVNRFGIIYEGWGFYNYIDGISFSCNKSIRVVGFGLYRPSSGDGSYTTTVKFCDGADSSSGILFEKEIAVMKSTDDPEDKIQKVFFDKPIKIREGQLVTCLAKTSKGNAFYGDQGKPEIVLENGLVFNFVTFQESYNSGGTDTNCGHVPEIYYFL